MQVDEKLIRSVVEQVLTRLGNNGNGHVGPTGGGYQGRLGQFTDVNEAVAAAREAFERLSRRTIEDRTRIIAHIRRIAVEQCVELGTMEMQETKIGRLPHKIEKLKTLGERSPGVEFMRSEVFSGDHGLAVIEHAPFGVICAITPVTHSLPTLTGNAVSMIAAGNTVVFNPHPSGRRIAAEGARRYNEAIYRDLGIDNLLCVITEPTIESANALFKHPDISLICVTGGPAVGRAAMQQQKRAIVAGPGNPAIRRVMSALGSVGVAGFHASFLSLEGFCVSTTYLFSCWSCRARSTAATASALSASSRESATASSASASDRDSIDTAISFWSFAASDLAFSSSSLANCRWSDACGTLAAPTSSAARIPEVEASVRSGGVLAQPTATAVDAAAMANTMIAVLDMCLIESSFWYLDARFIEP